MDLTSSAFNDGGRIPDRYGYTEANTSPPLELTGVPDGTGELVLIIDDPDAVEPAGKVWDHWVLYGIDPETTTIEEDTIPSGGTEGRNDYGEQGYGGPNPPDSEHTYIFTVYAIGTSLDLQPGMTKREVEDAIEDHVIEKTVLKGRYSP